MLDASREACKHSVNRKRKPARAENESERQVFFGVGVVVFFWSCVARVGVGQKSIVSWWRWFSSVVSGFEGATRVFRSSSVLRVVQKLWKFLFVCFKNMK